MKKEEFSRFSNLLTNINSTPNIKTCTKKSPLSIHLANAFKNTGADPPTLKNVDNLFLTDAKVQILVESWGGKVESFVSKGGFLDNYQRKQIFPFFIRRIEK